MVKMLVRHGANLEYVDHALRNALYWSVYNCCGEIAVFLLDCGAVVKPWSWIADEALPTSFLEDPVIYHRVEQARQGPHSLSILARYSERPCARNHYDLPPTSTRFLQMPCAIFA